MRKTWLALALATAVAVGLFVWVALGDDEPPDPLMRYRA